MAEDVSLVGRKERGIIYLSDRQETGTVTSVISSRFLSRVEK